MLLMTTSWKSTEQHARRDCSVLPPLEAPMDSKLQGALHAPRVGGLRRADGGGEVEKVTASSDPPVEAGMVVSLSFAVVFHAMRGMYLHAEGLLATAG